MWRVGAVRLISTGGVAAEGGGGTGVVVKSGDPRRSSASAVPVGIADGAAAVGVATVGLHVRVGRLGAPVVFVTSPPGDDEPPFSARGGEFSDTPPYRQTLTEP